MASKWGGLNCPDCGCKKMVAYCTRRIAGGMLRVRACNSCGRRVHTIEKITSVKSASRATRKPEPPGNPSSPGRLRA
jgi:hypothetical protein